MLKVNCLMKKILITLLLITSFAAAQNKCGSPMSNSDFNKAFEKLSRLQKDNERLELSKALLKDNCFSSNQIKMMALNFSYDESRLSFATKAYQKVTDRENYYEVFDAFKTYSAVFKLHDRITDVKLLKNLPDDAPVPVEPQITFPICDNYKGLKGCNLPMTDNDFNVLTMNFGNIPNEALRQQEAIKFVTANCLSMSQLMKLSLTLQMESSRLVFLKQTFLKIYDLDNYNYAAAVFANVPYKNDWITYAESKVTPVVMPVVVCEVKQDDFNQILKSIENENSSSVKLTLAKQIISAKKCFTCQQIKSIVTLMSFESGKLELAKYAYDFCIDKQNYYTVADAFSFSSSKEDLMNFIGSKK